MSTPEEKLDEAMSAVEELRSELQAAFSGILEDLSCAESCETAKDFRANLTEALAGADKILATIKAFRTEHKP